MITVLAIITSIYLAIAAFVFVVFFAFWCLNPNKSPSSLFGLVFWVLKWPLVLYVWMKHGPV